MKCASPGCSHGIGLVAHRRSWFGKQLYCSKKCRDGFVMDLAKRKQAERRAATYFEWLFAQPLGHRQPKLMPAVIRTRTR
jgi:hypothetical protein